MGKYILFIFVVAAAAAFYVYSPPKEKSELDKKEEGYLTSLMETKTEAQKKVGEAVQKENKKINEALMQTQEKPQEKTTEPALELVKKYSGAIIKTSLGDIEVKFFVEDSPRTVENFLKLSSQGFYDGIAFHRVIKDFMIQGGDPLSKEADWTKVQVGSGGPGYSFADEFNTKNLIRGSLAMANSGPNTNGSQFFIVTAPSTPWLDGKHTNFGQVVSGMEVVDKIENSKTNELDQPLEKITINSIKFLEK